MKYNPLQNPAVGRWFAPGLIAVLTIGAVTVITTRDANHPASAAMIRTKDLSSEEFQRRIASPNKVFDLVVKEHGLMRGPKTIKVNLGDTVRVNISAEGDEEVGVRLDGYDINTEASPVEGAEGGFSFIADTPGTFPFYALEERPVTTEINTEPLGRTQIGTIVVE